MPLVNRSPDYRTPQKVAAQAEDGLCTCSTASGDAVCPQCGRRTRPISMVGGGRGGALIAFTQAQQAGR